jgi:zinc protease
MTRLMGAAISVLSSLLWIPLPARADVVALPANNHAGISLAVQFRAGAVDDPPGKAGLTRLTAELMAEGGTEKLDARELRELTFPMATEIHARVDKELTTFSTTFHKDHVAQMTALLGDVIAHPRWDEKEFARLRDAAMNDVEKRLRQGDDENLGKEALGELMYRGHVYGRTNLGHLADLKSITLADCKAQAQKLFTLDRMTLGLAGGYPKGLAEKLQTALASLPAKSAAPSPIAAASVPGARVLLVEKDGEATAVSLGFPWKLSRNDPDFVALTVARSAFGEHRTFNGRLMQRLRELRGLNYGDYAYLEHFQQEGEGASQAQTGRVRHQQDFTIWLRPVQNENALFALRGALYELQRSLKDEPFSKEEVESTKSFLDGYVLLFAQTDARKLGYALDDHFLGNDDFLGEWHRKLKDVTADQVNAAWKKWIDPNKLQIVMVTPKAAQVKQALSAPSPIHYEKGAPPKPKDVVATDTEIEKFPIKGSVEIVPVDQLF